MLPRARKQLGFLALVALMVTSPVFAQVEPGAVGGDTVPENDTQMAVPAPVSGEAYPNTVGSDARSNYLMGGVDVTGGYQTNVLPGSGTTPQNDATFSIMPMFMFSRSTPRQEAMLSYSPSFLIYEPTGGLNSLNQGAQLAYHYRLSQRVSLSLNDSFYRTSNVFDQSYTFSNGAVSGSAQTPPATVIDPFTEMMSNVVRGTLGYQFGRNGMVGAGGSMSTFNYPNSTNLSGVVNSTDWGATAFYNRRLTRSQYFGCSYQFGRTTDGDGLTTTKGLILQSTTETHSVLPFYTLDFARAFSISVSAGVEHADEVADQTRESSSWSPSFDVSGGWQGRHADLSASYAHVVATGGGLFGAFYSNNGTLAGGWKFSQTWAAAFSANYMNLNSVTSQSAAFGIGTTISGQGSVARTLGEHFKLTFGYERLHEDYPGIPALSAIPDSNQAYARIDYHFTRPIGR